jgi:predicted DNA-binding transcriptional regulator YafY
LYRHEAVVRLSPRGLELFPYLFNTMATRAVMASAGTPDAEGWTRVTVPMESITHAPAELLRLGAEAEVIGPPELRERMAEIADGLAGLYRRESPRVD